MYNIEIYTQIIHILECFVFVVSISKGSKTTLISEIVYVCCVLKKDMSEQLQNILRVTQQNDTDFFAKIMSSYVCLVSLLHVISSHPQVYPPFHKFLSQCLFYLLLNLELDLSCLCAPEIKMLVSDFF